MTGAVTKSPFSSPVSYLPAEDEPTGINALDKDLCTPLYHAVQAVKGPEDIDKVRELMKKGALPFIGCSSFRFAQDNVPLVLVLLNAEHSRVLQGCKNLSGVCDHLFPKIHNPLDCTEEIQSLIKYPKALECFEKGRKKINREELDWDKFMTILMNKLGITIPESNPEERQAFLIEKSLQAPLEIIQQALSEAHPLFKLLWECAGNPKLLLDEERAVVDYTVSDHTVYIPKSKNFFALVEYLIYGVFRSLHKDTEKFLLRAALHREVFTVIKVFMELQNKIAREVLYNDFFPEKVFYQRSLRAYWRESHMPGSHHHADRFREQWETSYLDQFLDENPHFLKRVLPLLEPTEKKS